MTLDRIRITPRKLVGEVLGATPLTASAVETAVSYLCRRGYVANYVPPPHAYDQRMVLLPAKSPFVALYRCLAIDGSPTPVRRGLIDCLTDLPLSHVLSGMILAGIGLAVLRDAGSGVILRGTWMAMAYGVNLSRCMDLRPCPCWTLIERALGLVVPAAEIDIDLRLRVSEVFNEYDVFADGLLDDDGGRDTCTLVSPWRFSNQL